MEEEKNVGKDLIIKSLKIAVFCGLGFWAAGALGAVIGLIIAMAKFKD